MEKNIPEAALVLQAAGKSWRGMVGTFGPKPSQAKVPDFFSHYPLWKKERLPNSIHVGAIVAVPPSFFIQMILEKAEIIGGGIGIHAVLTQEAFCPNVLHTFPCQPASVRPRGTDRDAFFFMSGLVSGNGRELS